MIIVYFETNGYAEQVAQFKDEAVYIACLPTLEKLAKVINMTVTESVSEDI